MSSSSAACVNSPFGSLPTEITTQILHLAARPSITSLVCQEWHEICNNELFLSKVLNNLSSSLGNARFVEICHDFQVKSDSSDKEKIQKLFHGLHRCIKNLSIKCSESPFKVQASQHKAKLQAINSAFFPGSFKVALDEAETAEINLEPVRYIQICIQIPRAQTYFLNRMKELTLTLSSEQQAGLNPLNWKKEADYALIKQEAHHLKDWMRSNDVWKDAESMTTIDIGCTPFKSSMPPQIARFPNVSILKFEHNDAPSVPEVIEGLPLLTELHLKGNKITELPRSIGRLSKLTSIDISNNPLQRVPAEILELPSLKKFSFSFPGMPENVIEWENNLGLPLEYIFSQAEITIY